MNELQAILESPMASSFGQTMIHSLWQGVILVGLYFIAARFLKSATQKVWMGLSTFGLQFIASVVTFLYLKPAASQSWATTSANLETGFGLSLGNAANAAPWTVLMQQQAHWLALGWIIGFSFLLLRQMGGMAYVQFLKNSVTLSLSPHSQKALDNVLTKINGNLPNFQVHESSKVSTAMVLGFLKPIILIPAAFASNLSSEQLELIIAHEIAHIKRNDFLINLAQTILENLFFYHPVYWIVSHQIRENREHACDDWAAAITGNRVLLAKTLAQIQLGSQTPQLAMAFGKKRTPVLNRIQRLLGINPEGHKVKLTAILLMLAALTTVNLVKAQELTQAEQIQRDKEVKNVEEQLEVIEVIKEQISQPIEFIEPIIINSKVAMPDSNIYKSVQSEQNITYDMGEGDIHIRNEKYNIEIDEESIHVNGKEQALSASERKKLKGHWTSMRTASKDIKETSKEIKVEADRIGELTKSIMKNVSINPAEDPSFQKGMKNIQKEAEKIGEYAQEFQEELGKLDPQATNYNKQVEKLQLKLELNMKPHQEKMEEFEVEMVGFESRMKDFEIEMQEQIEIPMQEIEMILEEKEEIIEKSADEMEFHHEQIIRECKLKSV